MEQNPQSLAKITWTDPVSGERRQHVLVEGATVMMGRSSSNDITIPDRHVSRQHAVINYRDGVFMINDLNSVNGTFVNDQQIDKPYPLFSGDEIRLYVPRLIFAAADEEDKFKAEREGTLITPTDPSGKSRLVITCGPQEGHVIPLLIESVTIGRATSNASWEIGLQDPAVSRPHARLEQQEKAWYVQDLGSANGTILNNVVLDAEHSYPLKDGDIMAFGTTLVLFRE